MTALALRGLAAAALFAVAACAGGSGMNESYSSELNRLTEDCRARGGILTPNDLTASGASVSGAPERDFVCKINGEPSSRTR
ncbi:hypothetical protein [Brevundimonas fluminis]|jgi:hypothetical protein|uniref:hypothetical protein n=1 Tax=Brevundimonas fluminis TaxID=2487274 RepID=UPI000F6564A0|nr:hypothetical protein [Brevundimonas fluminis]